METVSAGKYPPPLTQAIILIVAILATGIESIDLNALNVVLPNLMKEFNVNIHTSTWAVTAYIIAASVFSLLSGRLITLFGSLRLILIALIGFAVSSTLCGLSTSFSEIIFFRALEGMFGACLLPLSEYLLLKNFPKHFRPALLAIWGFIILLTTISSPLLAGIIVKLSSWRYIFFVNNPIVLLTIILAIVSLTNDDQSKTRIDIPGFAFLAITVVGAEFLINEGFTYNWLQSKLICYILLATIVFGIFFIWRGIAKKRDAIIDFDIFRNRLFTISAVIATLLAITFAGVNTLMPVLTEKAMGYDIIMSGWIFFPAGLAGAIGIALSGQVVKYIDSRVVIFIGLAICIFGSLWLTKVPSRVSIDWFVWINVIRGFGFGIAFLPVVVLSVQTISDRHYGTASGFFNFVRNIGKAIGVNFTSGIFNVLLQHNWHKLTTTVASSNPHYQQWLQQQMVFPIFRETNPALVGIIGSEIGRQSIIMSFITVFLWSSIVMATVIILLLFIGKVKLKQTETIASG